MKQLGIRRRIRRNEYLPFIQLDDRRIAPNAASSIIGTITHGPGTLEVITPGFSIVDNNLVCDNSLDSGTYNVLVTETLNGYVKNSIVQLTVDATKSSSKLLDFTTTMPSDVTFSRSSLAMMWDANGKLTYCHNNLLSVSRYGNPAAGATQTQNATEDENGVVRANTIVKTGGSIQGFASQPFSSTIGTYYIGSVKVKAGTSNYCFVRIQGGLAGLNHGIGVNLTDGSVVATNIPDAPIAYSVESLGNGFYRIGIKVQATGAASPSLHVGPYDNNGNISYSGDGDSIHYVDMMVEAVTYQTEPSEFVEVTGTPYYGPRFETNPVTGERTLLLEPAGATNLELYSETISDSNWSGSGISKTSTSEPDMRGTSTAVRLTSNGASSSHFIYSNNLSPISYTSGSTYTFARWVRAETQSLIQLTGPSSAFGAAQYANFDLSTGAVTASVNCTASIRQAGAGYYKIAITITATVTTSATGCVLVFISSATDSRLPTNTLNTSVILAAGQAEAGTVATSFIPTAGSAAARAPDLLSIQNLDSADWFNPDEGTILIDFDAKYRTDSGGAAFPRIFEIGNSSNTSDRIGGVLQRTSNSLFANVYASAVAQFDTTILAGLSGSLSGAFALTYKQDDFAAKASGASLVTDTSGTVTPSATRTLLDFGRSRWVASSIASLKLRSFRYYPTRLTNAQIEALVP